MDFMTAMDIAASGMSSQRTHMNTISMNLANVNTTKTADGGPYQRKEVVFQSVPVSDRFESMMRSELDREVKGVKVVRIQKDDRPLKQVHDPGHPDADEQGYVSYPDINVVEEMANMLTATRAYEANLSSMTTVRSMVAKALQIAR
jgi:flagellar basal-body rod protein FlgC